MAVNTLIFQALELFFPVVFLNGNLIYLHDCPRYPDGSFSMISHHGIDVTRDPKQRYFIHSRNGQK